MAEPLPLQRILDEQRKKLEQGVTEGVFQNRTISERLARKFGFGESRVKRQALYEKLEKLAQKERDRIEEIISEAVAEAVNARDPGRYFCVAIKAKLKEARLTRVDARTDW